VTYASQPDAQPISSPDAVVLAFLRALRTARPLSPSRAAALRATVRDGRTAGDRLELGAYSPHELPELLSRQQGGRHARDRLVDAQLPAAVQEAVAAQPSPGSATSTAQVAVDAVEALLASLCEPAAPSSGVDAPCRSARQGLPTLADIEQAVAVAALSVDQRHVVRLRFGLSGVPACRLAEAADVVGGSRQSVRKLESSAMSSLRRHPFALALAARAPAGL